MSRWVSLASRTCPIPIGRSSKLDAIRTTTLRVPSVLVAVVELLTRGPSLLVHMANGLLAFNVRRGTKILTSTFPIVPHVRCEVGYCVSLAISSCLHWRVSLVPVSRKNPMAPRWTCGNNSM